MGLGLYTGISLSLKQELPMRQVNPILGLSPQEQELLLDQSLERLVQEYNQSPPADKDGDSGKKRGNFVFHRAFKESCDSVKGTIQRDTYLETPQVIVEKGEQGYSSRYNTILEDRIKQKLAKFKRGPCQEKPDASQIFSLKFEREREWVVKQQLAIAKYICETQEKYLASGNPLDLSSISQKDVAKHIEYSETTISRLMRNLTIQAPDGKVMFAEELVPGYHFTTLKGTHALRQLQQCPEFYEQGSWKVPDHQLKAAMKENYGIDVARRTVTKYRRMLE